MKSRRVLASALASLVLVGPSWADVRTIPASQILARPTDQTFTQFAKGVAIDGAAIIVLAANEVGQSALLYRRSSGSSPFTYQRVLLSVSDPSAPAQVRMKNGIAAVQFGSRVWIFENLGGDYVSGSTAAPIQHPGGIAISASSVLIGGDDCNYDAVVYQKRTDGNWGITGRMDDNQGECQPEGLAVELNYDYALLRVPLTNVATAWRRNGTALEWLPAGRVTMPSGMPASYGPLALQKQTAVTPGSFVFRRDGSTWTRQGSVIPVDYGYGSGNAFDVRYRDGKLLTTEAWDDGSSDPTPYVYLETSPGQFQHVAVLSSTSHLGVIDHDVSGRSVVTADGWWVRVYFLPEPLAAPTPIADDFEDRNTSAFTFRSGQFAIATRGGNDVLTQTSTSGLSLALANDSDWTYVQSVEADIAPTFLNTRPGGDWVGLVARYVDDRNFYSVTVRRDNTFGLYRRLNGVQTLLAEGDSFGVDPSRVRLLVNNGEISVSISNQNNMWRTAYAIDKSLPHGRAGLATNRAGADFDNVRIAGTGPLLLLRKTYDRNDGSPVDAGRPFTELGGDWQVQDRGLVQSDASGMAFAFIGAPVRNQEIEAAVRVDAISSQTAAWVALLARYVDARTHYYVTLTSTNRAQIRKKVDGVVTVLASAVFTVTPGQTYGLRFRLIEDQLQLFMGSTLIASAHDDEIPAGRHGLATNYAAATWNSVRVSQP
jgi:hypothetical protein